MRLTALGKKNQECFNINQCRGSAGFTVRNRLPRLYGFP